MRHTLFPPNQHEEITGRERSQAIEAIQLTKCHGFRNVVNFVVTKRTLPYISHFCNEALMIGIDEIQFMNFICINRAAAMASDVLDMADIDSFWRRCSELMEDDKYSQICFDFQANFGHHEKAPEVFRNAAHFNRFCLGGIWRHGNYLYITPEDDIYPCAMLTEPQFKIGRLVKKNGRYSYEIIDNDWESIIPQFDRSSCASLQYVHSKLGFGSG